MAVDPQDVTGWQVALLLIMSILATTGVRPVQHTVMLFYPQLLQPSLGAGRANYYCTSLSQAIQTRELQTRFWLVRERQHRSDWSEKDNTDLIGQRKTTQIWLVRERQHRSDWSEKDNTDVIGQRKTTQIWLVRERQHRSDCSESKENKLRPGRVH